MTNYVELHAASAFSFLEAASQPEDLVERAARTRSPRHRPSRPQWRLWLRAHAHQRRAQRHPRPRRRRNFHLCLGFRVPLAFRRQPGAEGAVSRTAGLPLLCTSRTGYQNLCQLITQFKMRETTKTEGAATRDDLAQYAEGLLCLTGGDEGPARRCPHHRRRTRRPRPSRTTHLPLRPRQRLRRAAAPPAPR